MNQIDELQQLWQDQPAAKPAANATASIMQKAAQQQRAVRLRHISTMVVLGVTIAVLLWFFLRYAGNAGTAFTTGMFMMMGSLLVRVLTEYISFRRFQRLSVLHQLKSFQQELLQFYQWRFRIHTIATPVLYGLYIIGFVLLLPVFYQQFSRGFFAYILVSGFGFLAVFAWRLRKEMQQELKLLTALRQSVRSMEDAD